MQNEKIRCIVAAPDEFESIQNVLKEFRNIHVVQKFSSGKKLSDHLQKEGCDILILNPAIFPDDVSIFDSIKNISEIIFISSDMQFAVEGYHYNICGFISLPVNELQIYRTLQKAEQNIIRQQKVLSSTGKLVRSFLFIRAEYKLMKINFDDILYIEGLKDYSKIYTRLAANKAIITLQNLKSFEEKLPSEEFIRVHRSYIVSLSKIDVIHKNSILIGKTEIPVSDGFRAHLHSFISKYL